MADITIVADDLTGAVDCAASCARLGLQTWVCLRGQPPPAQVVSIDMRSRHLPHADAARTTAATIAGIEQGVLYAKIDSTLRGQPGVELSAALSAWRQRVPDAVLMFAPAFPDAARTTTKGRQYAHGEQVGDLSRLFDGLGLRLRIIAPGHLSREHFSDAVDVLICDATENVHLQMVARVAGRLGTRVVWAGSAGLARFLPGALELHPGPQNRRTGRRAPERAVLLLAGSRSQVTQRQLASLQTPVTRLSPETLRSAPDSPVWLACTDAVSANWEAGSNTAIAIDGDASHEDPRLATALARFALPFLRSAGGLILTGGDTARAVLDILGVSSLQVLGEVEAGVPISVTSTGVTVITKAGAFGDPGTLNRCLQAAILPDDALQ